MTLTQTPIVQLLLLWGLKIFNFVQIIGDATLGIITLSATIKMRHSTDIHNIRIAMRSDDMFNVVLSVITLNVMLSDDLFNVVMLSVITLNVMLSDSLFIDAMLSVITLNVMLSYAYYMLLC